MKVFSTLAILALSAATAAAATVKEGATRVGDTYNIEAVGDDVAISADGFSYSAEVTTPASEWVWVGDLNSVDSVVFEFSFDLSGFDIATATLSGRWGVDNFGYIELNGTEIARLTGNVVGHFSLLRDYGSSDDALFNAGMNTVSYYMFDGGGPAAFRATAVVTAEDAVASPVPLPAGLPLLAAGLGGLAVMRRSRKG